MSERKDFCKYVDVFYGNGEVDHYAKEGLASKWFYIKALCGNTTPHAVLPFGKMSVGAYSGGYTTGYGTHGPNTCGGVPKFSEELKIRGFSHLHQTGVGGIGYYYNYAIVSPFYGDIADSAVFHKVEEEEGRPGYYRAKYNDVNCELTVDGSVAFHHYHFRKRSGRVAVDFSNDGLCKDFGKLYYGFASDASIQRLSDSEVLFSGVLSGVKLYFCVKAEGERVKSRLFYDERELTQSTLEIEDTTRMFGGVFDFCGEDVFIKVSYSTLGYEQARKNVNNAVDSFEKTAKKAYDVWNDHLAVIDVSANDEKLKEKFYSNFYHTIIKPVDMTGEIIMGVKGDLVSDFATFWDQYKTQLPLIFMLYPEMGKKIVKCLKNISKTHGKIFCSFGTSEMIPDDYDEQAKMRGIIALADAYYSGVAEATEEIITECIRRELSGEDFKCFMEEGVFEKYTHILDTTDACLAAAEITKDKEFRKLLLDLGKNWVKAYDEDGLMSVKSQYYEGNRYTYSFRLQKNMEERIALAGGNDRFKSMLDDFFGYDRESIQQIHDNHLAGEAIERILNHYNRFEGFNNECDMETPFAYLMAGYPKKTQEIVHESVVTSFGLGKGGIPGNNDSGGLSSCFVWNALGLFPASGRGEMLIGSPHFCEAVIKFANGKELKLIAKNVSEERYYVNNVMFNGIRIDNFRIPTAELLQGGEIVFEMV